MKNHFDLINLCLFIKDLIDFIYIWLYYLGFLIVLCYIYAFINIKKLDNI
jgi:hypothetical protein